MDDIAGMRLAIQEAEAAAAEGEVPVGAVLVAGGQVRGRGRNRMVAGGDPLAHAEVQALRMAGPAARERDAVLYVTLEPCLMCAGAIVLARVPRVVFGCDDPKAGAVRSLYTTLSDARLNHRCRVTGGVLADACAGLLAGFFRNLRDRS